MAISVTAESARWAANGRRKVLTAIARSKGSGSGDGFKVIDLAEVQVACHHDADARALVLVEGWGDVERLFQDLGDDFLAAFAGVVKANVVAAGLPLVGRPAAEVAHERQQDGVAKALPEVIVDVAIQPRFAQGAGAG